MSPEQARGDSQAATARSDIYSLGVVFYQLLTGELPFRGNNRMQLLQLLEDEPPSLHRINSAVPRDLESVCLCAMAKEPRHRYPSAQAFADDLRRYLDGRPVQARPPTALGKLFRWCRRRRLIASLTVLLTTTILGGGLASTILWRQAERQRVAAEHQRDRAETERARTEWNYYQMLDHVRSFVKVIRDDQSVPFEARAAQMNALVTVSRTMRDELKYYADSPRFKLLVRDFTREIAETYAAIGRAQRQAYMLDGLPNYQSGKVRQSVLNPYFEARKLWDELDARWPGFYDHREHEIDSWLAQSEDVASATAAADALDQARWLLEQLNRERPRTYPYHRQLARCNLLLADARRAAHQLNEADAALQRASAMLESYPQRPYSFERDRDFLECLVRQAELRVEQGRKAEARAVVAEARQLLEECQRQRDEANARSPGLVVEPDMLQDLAKVFISRVGDGQYLIAWGKLEELRSVFATFRGRINWTGLDTKKQSARLLQRLDELQKTLNQPNDN